MAGDDDFDLNYGCLYICLCELMSFKVDSCGAIFDLILLLLYFLPFLGCFFYLGHDLLFIDLSIYK